MRALARFVLFLPLTVASSDEIQHASLSAPALALAAEMLGRSCEIVAARQVPNLPSGILEVQVRLPALSNVNPGVHAFDLVVGLAPEPWYFSSARFSIFFRASVPAN